jgi:ABC-type polysaccharide/polyol phosphate export permease
VFLKQNANALTAGNGHTKSFALYLFCALTVWNAFANGINQSISSFLAAGPMLTRTYFPPECPIFAGTLTTLTQTLIESTILFGFMAALGNLGWAYLLVPAILILLTAFAFGLGMLAALLNVRYRDINYLVGIGLQVLFYATPIVYRVDTIGHHPILGIDPKRILDLNPMTHFVEAMRAVAYAQQAPSLRNWFAMTASALVSVAFGWWIFDRRSPQLIEEI